MKPSRNLFLRSASLAAIIGLGGMHSAQAEAITWTGATSGNWLTTTNWSGTGKTPASNNLIFSNNVNTNITTSTLTLAAVTNAIQFSTGAGAFTLGSATSRKTITFGTVNNMGVTVNTGVTTNQTINDNLSFGGDSTTATVRILNNGTGLLKITGTVGTAGSNKTLELTGGGNIELTNIVGGAAQKGLKITGTGIVTLSGANTYAGAVTVNNGGALVFQKTQANSGTATNGTVASGATIGLGVGGSGYYDAAAVTSLFGGTLSGFNGTGGSISGTCNVGIDTTAGNFDYTTSVTSTRGLMKLGTNTLTLSGTNQYTGATTVRVGTLKLGAAGALGNGTNNTSGVSVTSGAVLDLNGQTPTASAVGLTLNGTGISSGGALINSNATTATYGGLLALGSASSIIATTGDIDLTNTGTITGATFGLTVGGAKNTSISGIIGTTTGTLTKQDAGTLTLSGANTYTGTTTISGGVLALSGSGTLGGSTADLTMGGGQLNLGGLSPAAIGAVSVTTAYASGDTIRNGSLTGTSYAASNTTGDAIMSANLLVNGSAGFAKSGAGTVTLSGDNTFDGATTVSSGILKVGHVNGLGASGTFSRRTIISTGGTLELATDTSVANEFLDVASSNTGAVVVNLATEGAGITHSTGTTYLGSGSTMNVTKGTNVTSGTATLGIASVVLASGSNGTGTLNADTAAISVTGSVSSGVAFAKTLELGGSHAESAISGVISNGSGTVSLTKSGSGTWTLSNGTNSYTGATTINGGELVIGTGGSLGNTAVTVGGANASGTPTLAGVGTIGGNTLISEASGGAVGNHAPGLAGVSGGVGTQAFSGDLTYGNGSIFEWDINDNSTSTGFDKVTVGGSLNGSTGLETSIFRVVFGTTAKTGIEDSGNAFWNTASTSRAWSMTSLFGKDFTSGMFTDVETYDAGGVYDVSAKGTFTITGTSLTWTAVPEPTSALAGLLITAGLLRRRRKF